MSQHKTINNIEFAGETLSIDRIFRLLADPRRRYTLYYLYLCESPVYLPDIAEQIANWEHNTDVTSDDCTDTYTDLYHSHIPKLADAGVIDYIEDTEMVTLTEFAGELRPYLEQTADGDLTTAETLSL